MTLAVVAPVAANGIASTVEKDEPAPPPNTKACPPSTAPAASWVPVVNDPATAGVPAGTAMVATLAVEMFPLVKPPRTTTRPEPESELELEAEPATTTSRLSGCASVHGRTPDSTAASRPLAGAFAPVVAGGEATDGEVMTDAGVVPCRVFVGAAVEVVFEAFPPGPGAELTLTTMSTTTTMARTPPTTVRRRRRRVRLRRSETCWGDRRGGLTGAV